jgi:pimeloyl-ACP methyl ester carboxylesterase
VHEDRFVDAHDGIPIAIRDHGGTGPAFVLLHGAGGHLLSLFNLVRKLEDEFRVVSMDSRWSGQSGDSEPYQWDDLVRDVEAVVEQLGLEHPVVAGHSWGGMIAAYYGAAHPEARAVINIDGHGSGDPSLYDGLTAEEVEATRAKMAALNDGAMPTETEGDDEWHAARRIEVRAMTELMGVPADLVDEWTDRNFVELSPGRWRRHPTPTLMTGLQGDLELFSLYRRVECPLQIFNCSAPDPGIPADLHDFMAAYRRGLTRALAALAAERPNVDVVELPDHFHNGVLARGAKDAAAEMRRFLSSLG